MKPLSLSTILKASGINGPAPSVTIQYVGDNIRKIRNRSVIFHLNKERSVNVKRFRRLEHCYIITDQPLIKNTLPEDKVYYVPNIQAAYLNFARYYRGLFDVKVVAVTGTCGKSSTKEMIAQVLQKKGPVVFTFQSRNGLS
ncbi:MAG TPA: Mur ligase family protein, partial [Bacilli bacterium]|nr:Mur ligase family protein [Bacilli bacterium]